MSNSSRKGVALITGASSGIGAVYADRLAKRGYDLILVARNEARLKSLSARLTSETGRSTKVLPIDLSNRAELAMVEATLRNDPSISMLVNNAGTASVAPLLNADANKMDEIIALNITALTRLTYAAAPAFVARGTGAIINIGSVVGHMSLRSAIRCSTSSPIKASASKRCCRARPQPTSGRSLASHGRNCRPRSSCPWKTWSMQRWPGSTRVNW